MVEASKKCFQKHQETGNSKSTDRLFHAHFYFIKSKQHSHPKEGESHKQTISGCQKYFLKKGYNRP